MSIMVTLNRKFRKPMLAFMKKHPRFRRNGRKVYYDFRGQLYKNQASKVPTNEKMVVFESFGGRQVSCSPRAIYEAMLADPRFDDWTFVWSFRKRSIAKMRQDPMMERAQLVARCYDDYFEIMQQAKYWVVNTRVPEYVHPKDDQVYVQCWHGTPLKCLGFDVAIDSQNALNSTEELAWRFGIDSEKWSYLLSPSPYTSLHLADAFGLPEERRADVVLEEGYPRNDRVAATCADPDTLAAAKAEICEKLGIPQDKKLFLYAPTWRDDAYQAGKGYVMEDTLLDFDRLRETMEADGWIVLFRAHYYIANKFDFEPYEGFVYDVSRGVDINDLYIISDALMTDYSSVFFDYAITKRPILFFWPDWEHYANAIRGFYFDLKELPGPHCFNMDDVVEAIGKLDSYDEMYGEAYAEFRQTFCPKDDGHAAERVINKVFDV
ncbi:CDP-glycerol glycerophosphotransferase family protein [Slackia heliotrinireducens]|uniref:CDP-glycerol glycerophosphotransferase family protein n=1 Tax=Slackia heliotrinireducens TaxID=84110 RepID=UPI003315CCD1